MIFHLAWPQMRFISAYDVKHGIVRRPVVGVYTRVTEADGERRDTYHEAQDGEGALGGEGLWLHGMGHRDTPSGPTQPMAILSGWERNGSKDIPESSGDYR